MSEEKVSYEIWNFAGHGRAELISDDPMKIANWLLARPVRERNFAIHPNGPGYNFHHSWIDHDFIAKYGQEIADDIVKKAFETGNPDGVAKKILDLAFGR